MKLTKLQLENFRNYNRYTYEFDPETPITVLIGPNGKGKTNLLEAIYLLSIGRSFRTAQPEDLIEWEMDYLRATAEITTNSEHTTLEVFYETTPRKHKGLKKNDVKLKNAEFIGNLVTVLFHPEDLNMLYLSPSLRRRYMDILLSQTSRDYLYNLSKYNKILKQRNSLLKEIRDAKFKHLPLEQLEEDLQAWNHQLIQFGIPIIEERRVLTKYLQKNLQKTYQSISGGEEKIDITYLSKIIKNAETNLQQQYQDELFNRHSRDIIQATTTAGPHRDDLIFTINGEEISLSASRGEFRTLLLAIKLAEISYIKDKMGVNPILLLDDVFSELDISRQSHLLNAIKECQTIITTTDASDTEKITKESQSVSFVKIE